MGKLQMPYFNSINNTVIVIQKVFDSLFSAQICPQQPKTILMTGNSLLRQQFISYWLVGHSLYDDKLWNEHKSSGGTNGRVHLDYPIVTQQEAEEGDTAYSMQHPFASRVVWRYTFTS
jgi:hypothetical protein